MGATVYTADEVPPDRLATGYVRRDGAFVEEPFDGYGALASMGGIFSSVRDLAIWVAGFTDAFPPRDDPEGPHPLSRASRREMQQVHRVVRSRAAARVDRRGAGADQRRVRPGAVRDARPAARPRRGPQRRLSGVRIAHALAPGVGRRRDRPREPDLRADVDVRGRGARRARDARGRADQDGGAVGRHAHRADPDGNVCCARGTTTWRRRCSPSTWTSTTRSSGVVPRSSGSANATARSRRTRTCRPSPTRRRTSCGGCAGSAEAASGSRSCSRVSARPACRPSSCDPSPTRLRRWRRRSGGWPS